MSKLLLHMLFPKLHCIRKFATEVTAIRMLCQNNMAIIIIRYFAAVPFTAQCFILHKKSL